MWIVWTGGNDRLWDVLSRREPRLARLPEDGLVAPDAALLARQPLELPRPGQRALLQEGHRARSEPLRPLARRARSGLPARSVRRTRTSTRASRSARAARPCRSAPTTASRPASSACGCSRTRTSTRRRARAGTRSATTATRAYYESTRPRAAVPRRHVVRLLPRRAESGQAAGRSGEPEVGEPQLERRRAVLLVGSHLRLEGRRPTSTSFLYQRCHTSLPGTLDTSLVSTDNINNPRTMNAVYLPRPAHGAGASAGARRRSPAASLDNKQFNDFVPAGRSARAVLRAARHDVDAAGAQGRLRLGRRARRAQPRVPEHRPVQRGVAAALPAADRRPGHLADQDRRRAEELGLLAGHRAADARTWRASSSASTDPHLPEGRAGRPVAI